MQMATQFAMHADYISNCMGYVPIFFTYMGCFVNQIPGMLAKYGPLKGHDVINIKYKYRY